MLRGVIFAATLLLSVPALAGDAPYTVAPHLFDVSRPDDLGLKPAAGTQTITIYSPTAGGETYVNGVVLFGFKNKLYAQWQTSQKDEDSTDTHVVYAVSEDGLHWSAPRILADVGKTIRTSGGWGSDGKILTAYINIWNSDFHTGGRAFAITSEDGEHWSKPKPVTGADGKPIDGVIEQDPHSLPNGRILAAFHLQPGVKLAPYYTDDRSGLTGWVRGKMANLPHEGLAKENLESRELEPSFFLRPDGCAVLVMRDQADSFRQLASQSCDGGRSWTTPVLTAMPDSRAKQSAGNLSDGTAFLVNAPSGTKLRSPLALSLSKDGTHFDRAILLRAGPPPEIHFPGLYKRPGYHYPKSLVWRDALYVGYASGKEVVEMSRIPLSALR
ncbi:hypothetical protein FHS83_003639 [Rhizomicrobium palustre]|uniref:Sialidase domain-containing protein n=1 Tax=Rhizomicrobium palustre TaxID=189966 RepID=A0A846N548_9PROT|nr:sialidase family protein [Rhizomicrobium palustre]NIK90321.1 hypothetical protein [Rhizomicrobium palustre]